MVDSQLERMQKANVPSPEATLRWLIQAGYSGQPLHDAVTQRIEGVPLQHILGETDFRYGTLTMRRNVFIPRPETEWLVELAKPYIADQAIVVEIGTGSGAISHALISECLQIQTLIATDINPDAVALATQHLQAAIDVRNTKVKNQADSFFATVVEGTFFDGVEPSLKGNVSMVISNPPYLSHAQWETLHKEVQEHDPYEALVGGIYGNEMILTLCNQAQEWLAPGGYLLIEDDPERVHENLAACTWGSGSVYQDLAGRDRFFIVRKHQN